MTYYIVTYDSLFVVPFSLMYNGEIANTFFTSLDKQWGVFVSENIDKGFGINGGVVYTFNGEEYKVTTAAGIVQPSDYVEPGNYFLSK